MAIVLLSLAATVPCSGSSETAFLLLSQHVMEEELDSQSRIGAIVSIGAGAIAFLGAGAMWFWGDDVTAAVSTDHQSWAPTTKYVTCASLAATGLLGAAAGIGFLIDEEEGRRGRYSEIFDASDPDVRETMAAEALSDLAQGARRLRLLSAAVKLLVPSLTVCSAVASNVRAGRPWHEDLLSASAWQLTQLFSGVSALYNKTREERLYERYRAAEVFPETEF